MVGNVWRWVLLSLLLVAAYLILIQLIGEEDDRPEYKAVADLEQIRLFLTPIDDDPLPPFKGDSFAEFLEHCDKLGIRVPRLDPWKRSYQLRKITVDAGKIIEVRSAGRDGQFDTKDDTIVIVAQSAKSPSQ